VTRTSGGGPVSVSMWPGLSRHLAPHTLDFWRGHVLWQATSSPFCRVDARAVTQPARVCVCF
jgi:hypothetical protein